MKNISLYWPHTLFCEAFTLFLNRLHQICPLLCGLQMSMKHLRSCRGVDQKDFFDSTTTNNILAILLSPLHYSREKQLWVHCKSCREHSESLQSGHAFIFTQHHVGQSLLLLFTRPFPRDGGMAEDHGAPEPGQLPMV